MSNYTNIKIIDLKAEDFNKYGLGCLKNTKHQGFKSKSEWLKKRFLENLKLKILLENDNPVGFIEYIPSEFSWRGVDAKNFMMIHCIWVYPKIYQGKGYGGMLIEKCIEDSKIEKKNGVIVVTSEGPWIAGKSIFLNHSFKPVDKRDRFELLALNFDNTDIPKFKEILSIDRYKGLNLFYSEQCPMCIKFVSEIEKACREDKIPITISKIESFNEAQNNPSPFGVFSIVYNGKVVADNPISLTRFRNIVKKELNL